MEIAAMALLSAFGLLGTLFGLGAWAAARARPDLTGAQAVVRLEPDGPGYLEVRGAGGSAVLSFGPDNIAVLDENGRNLGSLRDLNRKHRRTLGLLMRGRETLRDAERAMDRGDLDTAERLLPRAKEDLEEARGHPAIDR